MAQWHFSFHFVPSNYIPRSLVLRFRYFLAKNTEKGGESILKSKRKIHHLFYGHVIKTFKSCQQCIKTKTKTVWYLHSHFWRRYRNKGTFPLAQFSFTFLGGDALQKNFFNIKIIYIYIYHISYRYLIYSYLYEILPVLFFNVSCHNIVSLFFHRESIRPA